MLHTTVRELAGEIWAEIEMESRDPLINGPAFQTVDLQALNRIIDIVMGVLARHDNALIVNDKDLPVEPRKRSFVQ